jgi:hypothetical protein
MGMVSNRKLDCVKCGFEIDAITTRHCPSCGSPIEGAKQDGNKKRGIKEWLSHPLILLIVGAAITSFLLPQLTASWQVNERELDLKLELADRINTPYIDLQTALSQILITNQTNQELEKGLEEASNATTVWINTCADIGTTIKLYYPPNSDLPEQTYKLCEDMGEYHILTFAVASEQLFGQSSADFIEDAAGNLTISEIAIDIGELRNSSSEDRRGFVLRLTSEMASDASDLTRKIIESDTEIYRRGIFG